MALATLRVGEAAALLRTAGQRGKATVFGDVPLKCFLFQAPSIPAAECDAGHESAQVTAGR